MAYNISQAGGAGTGGDDESLEDCWIGLPVSINLPVTAGATYLHVLLDKASDETATLVDPTAASATITPTVTGTFRVRSTKTLAGTSTTWTRVIRVTKTALGHTADGGICPTAFGELAAESNADGNTRGYVQRHEANFRAMAEYPEIAIAADGALRVDHWNTITGGTAFTIPDPALWRGRTLLAYSDVATISAITCTGTIVGGFDANTYNLPAKANGGSAVVFRSAKSGAARWLASGRI